MLKDVENYTKYIPEHRSLSQKAGWNRVSQAARLSGWNRLWKQHRGHGGDHTHILGTPADAARSPAETGSPAR